MTTNISLGMIGPFFGASVCLATDKAHTYYLRHKAIESLRTNNLAIHIFSSTELESHYYKCGYAYPIGGHYYDVGFKNKRGDLHDHVVISPFKGLYEAPCLKGTKITVSNKQTSWDQKDTWGHLINPVVVENVDETTKPIAAYLQKAMRRESHKDCGWHAIELSEAARSSNS